jgi:hypothetical protein
MRISYAALCASVLAACAPLESEETREDVGEADDALTNWTQPRLRWALFGKLGSAKLATYNPATGLSHLVTHNVASQFRAAGAAGNKLMWQSTTTGAVTLWTLNANGAMTGFNTVTPPSSSWRAVSIALSDDGACPAALPEYRTFVITFEGPVHPLSHQKQVRLRLVDNVGATLEEEVLTYIGENASVRDSRPAFNGEWSLLEERSSLAGIGANVTLFARSPTNGWVRLRSEGYTAASGITSCTEYALPGSGVNWRHCPASYVDNGLDASYAVASVPYLQAMPSETQAQSLAWAKTNGVVRLFGLEYDGPQLGAAIPLDLSATGYSLVTIAGADDSTEFPLFCDHSAGRPSEGPDAFGDLDLMP